MQPERPGRIASTRIGSDSITSASLVAARAELDQAARTLDERGIPHGAITDRPPFGISILRFPDPDHFQLELTAPHG